MKKFLLLMLIIISSFSLVEASEYPEVTDDIEIRYKWYKEIITGDYYPMTEIEKDDLIDINKIKYGDYSFWTKENCLLSKTLYDLEIKELKKYRLLNDTRYVLLENFEYKDNVKIYQKNKLIDFDIISQENNILKIDLKKKYMCDNLLFYIEYENNYKISLYEDLEFTKYIISKDVDAEKILTPDKTWVTEETKFRNVTGEIKYEETDLTTMIERFDTCRYREKYVYKYEIEKEYYDDNYYTNLEGYVKDTNDYKFFYKGEPIISTIEIISEKVVKEPQVEYIYIENENNTQENDSSKENNCTPEVKTEIKTEIVEVEKEIFKIPKKIYIIIFLLTLTIIVLIIKIYKKYVG